MLNFARGIKIIMFFKRHASFVKYYNILEKKFRISQVVQDTTKKNFLYNKTKHTNVEVFKTTVGLKFKYVNKFISRCCKIY